MDNKIKSAVLFSALVIFISCSHDPYYLNVPDPIITSNCNADTVYFVNEVLPLLQSGCGVSGCHSAASAEEGVVMTDYISIVQTGHVKPGHPKSSRLYKVIHGGGFVIMPPDPRPRFTSDQEAIIYKWIEQGAWNLECLGDDCDSTIFTFSGAVWPTVQTFCLGCHSNSNPGAGIQLTDYQHIASAASNPSFIGAITHTPPYQPMPQNGNQLSDCRIAQISNWISAGMPDN